MGVTVDVGRKVGDDVAVYVAVVVAVYVVVGDGPGVEVDIDVGDEVAVGGISGSSRSAKI